MPFMQSAVAAMVQLQLLTGARPGEICIIRACDLDTSGRVWLYRPASHKTEHHGHERLIFIGPRAQEVLRPWFRSDLQGYLFSPAASEERRNAARRQSRKTPMTPSQAKRKRKKKRGRPWGERYTTQSYARAIARACEKADAAAHEHNPTIPEDEAIVQVWTPNRLRHNAATNLRKEYGIELARIILGHSTAFTTEIYAEMDRKQAVEVIAKVG
jgi:integrase